MPENPSTQTPPTADPQEAARWLDGGGVASLPTETVYGLAARADRSDAVDRLAAFRQADARRRFALHLPDVQAVSQWLGDPSPVVMRGLRRLLPGPITVVARLSPERARRVIEKSGLSTAQAARVIGDDEISLRVPAHGVAAEALRAAGGPVIASVAARPGASPPRNALAACEAVADLDPPALVLDGGTCRFTQSSTIVRLDVEADPFAMEVVREGVFDARYLQKMMQWTLLLVCSGNTCRSPMAEGFARAWLASSHGVEPEALEGAGIRVISAGTAAAAGAPAHPDAVQTMREFDIDLTGHVARSLSAPLVDQADLILCMTRDHLASLLERFPAGQGKTFLLDPEGDVADPFGRGPAVYQQCAARIREQLIETLREHQA